jgi:aminomethyltransferase
MKKTTFNEMHKLYGAKLVEFANYEMPILYSSIIDEHKAVRNSVGVFDVSHMGEILVEGENALNFVQKITTNDASKLTNGKVQYSAMCYEDGGIVDDLLVYRLSENKFMLVINASNIQKDFEWMQKNNSYEVSLTNESDEYSLLAIQGRNSKPILEKLVGKEIDLEYYTFSFYQLAGIDCLISRTGYTGEIGYEIYFKGIIEEAEKMWKSIFDEGKQYGIKPIGLGARDTLRLEMGYCLYGNDIDETTNPIEANLGWITKLNKGEFNASEVLNNAKKNGTTRKLVPLLIQGKAFPRHGYEIVDGETVIGVITSGTVSPISEKPIAMGYVQTEKSAIGSEVEIKIRNKNYKAIVTKLPFVETNI